MADEGATRAGKSEKTKKAGENDKTKKGPGVELPPWATEAGRGWSLEIRHPEVEGASKLIAIDKTKFTLVGRHDGEFNMVVDHVTVSRRHALLVHKGDAVFLYDMSSNGSSVNGQPAKKKEYMVLQAGDELRFGDHPSTFTLTLQDGRHASTRPPVLKAPSATVSKGGAPFPAKRRGNAAAAELGDTQTAAAAGESGGTKTAVPAVVLPGNPLVVYGLKLHMGSKGLEVRTVEPDSIAESHPFPFSWGDLVLSINDADTSSMSKDGIRAALALGPSGDEVRLAIKKGGEVRQVVLGGEGKKTVKAARASDDDKASWQARLAEMVEKEKGTGSLPASHKDSGIAVRGPGEGDTGFSGLDDPQAVTSPEDARHPSSSHRTPTGTPKREQAPAAAPISGAHAVGALSDDLMDREAGARTDKRKRQNGK